MSQVVGPLFAAWICLSRLYSLCREQGLTSDITEHLCWNPSAPASFASNFHSAFLALETEMAALAAQYSHLNIAQAQDFIQECRTPWNKFRYLFNSAKHLIFCKESAQHISLLKEFRDSLATLQMELQTAHISLLLG
eukprot:TRINITY_DN3599_c0_g2_i2.p3 TRINITY_DN3599_c0_g2~~TRINITY_DN3599_c0_g2_i2.p3  ORF type:complete len:137 (-),score=7.33 TRINITY_DN3599_c0_g2_i2:453-863(-)